MLISFCWDCSVRAAILQCLCCDTTRRAIGTEELWREVLIYIDEDGKLSVSSATEAYVIADDSLNSSEWLSDRATAQIKAMISIESIRFISRCKGSKNNEKREANTDI